MTIASFAPQLGIITSKQRPRKLTIHGSDGEDHAFLLKGHEDLRQDERVMQVCSGFQDYKPYLVSIVHINFTFFFTLLCTFLILPAFRFGEYSAGE